MFLSQTPDIFPAFALYQHHSTSNSSGQANEGGTVSGESRNLDNGGGDHSGISVVATSLSSEHEKEVKEFLLKKLAKGNVYRNCGNISNLDLSLPGKSSRSTLCYYCLVREAASSGTLVTETDQVYSSSDFVVCVLSSPEACLDLFRSELDKYCAQLISLLDSDLTSLEETVRPFLETWYTDCTQYLCRCVQRLDEDVKYLIYAALADAKLEVECSNPEVNKDFMRFVGCCSLSELLNNPKTERKPSPSSPSSSSDSSSALLVDVSGGQVSTSEIASQRVVVKVTVSDDSHKFHSEHCTSFCEEWGKILAAGETDNPVFLRQVIENYKLKAIKDMNNLKRLLQQAETDFYALYRCCVFLQTGGNGAILLQQAKLEAATADDTAEGATVLSVLDEYIGKSGKPCR